MATYIYIDRGAMQRNLSHNQLVPPILVEYENGVRDQALYVEICGPSEVVYNKKHPITGGAHIAIKVADDVVLKLSLDPNDLYTQK